MLIWFYPHSRPEGKNEGRVGEPRGVTDDVSGGYQGLKIFSKMDKILVKKFFGF